MVKSAKADYYVNKFSDHKGDSKTIWRKLKNIGSSEKPTGIGLNLDNNICFDKKELLDRLIDSLQMLRPP